MSLRLAYNTASDNTLSPAERARAVLGHMVDAVGVESADTQLASAQQYKDAVELIAKLAAKAKHPLNKLGDAKHPTAAEKAERKEIQDAQKAAIEQYMVQIPKKHPDLASLAKEYPDAVAKVSSSSHRVATIVKMIGNECAQHTRKSVTKATVVGLLGKLTAKQKADNEYMAQQLFDLLVSICADKCAAFDKVVADSKTEKGSSGKKTSAKQDLFAKMQAGELEGFKPVLGKDGKPLTYTAFNAWITECKGVQAGISDFDAMTDAQKVALKMVGVDAKLDKMAADTKKSTSSDKKEDKKKFDFDLDDDKPAGAAPSEESPKPVKQQPASVVSLDSDDEVVVDEEEE